MCRVGCANVRKVKFLNFNYSEKNRSEKDVKALQMSKYLLKASKNGTRTLFMYFIVVCF